MRFDLITIFPKMFDGYLGESMLKRAQEKKLVIFFVHDLRRWATDKHQKVDDSPYGGGPGMVMKVEPFARALRALKLKIKSSKFKIKERVILTSAKGKQFTAADAQRLARYDRLIILCGRYEGVDERVAEHLADEELSIGPYVLTGGELAAMVIADAVARHIPGVLGHKESLEEKRGLPRLASTSATPRRDGSGKAGATGTLAMPQYTRPEKFRNWKVPAVLMSGDHRKIQEWRRRVAEAFRLPPEAMGRRKRQ